MKIKEIRLVAEQYTPVVEIDGNEHLVKGIMNNENRLIVFETLVNELQNEIMEQYETFKATGKVRTLGRFIEENKRMNLMLKTHVSELY